MKVTVKTFANLRKEVTSNKEREGLEMFFNMMLSLRQQVTLRKKELDNIKEE